MSSGVLPRCCFSRPAPLLRGCAIVAGAVLSVIALIQGLRPPVIQNYDVNLSGLPASMEGTVIVAMSDLWGPLIRLWRPGEILRVTLHTEGNSPGHLRP